MTKLNQQGAIPIFLTIILLTVANLGGGIYIASQGITFGTPKLLLNEPESSAAGELSEKLPEVAITDKMRHEYLSKISQAINVYASKTGAKPENLAAIDLNSLGFDLDPQFQAFVKDEVKYIIPANDFVLCAAFDAPSDKLYNPFFSRKVSVANIAQELQCFEMTISNINTYNKPVEENSDITGFGSREVKKTTAATSFSDPKIAALTRDENPVTITHKSFTTHYNLNNGGQVNITPGITKETGTMNFPYGFFSDATNEWGFIGIPRKQVFIEERKLLTTENTPLVIQVTFTEPVKLSSVSNLFSNCQNVDCYSWSVDGVTASGQTIPLIEKTISGKDSRIASVKGVSSDELFKSVSISVERIESSSASEIVWKKLKFYYK